MYSSKNIMIFFRILIKNKIIIMSVASNNNINSSVRQGKRKKMDVEDLITQLKKQCIVKGLLPDDESTAGRPVNSTTPPDFTEIVNIVDNLKIRIIDISSELEHVTQLLKAAKKTTDKSSSYLV